MRKIEIVICMGSSCFARGNDRNLKLLQTFFREREMEHLVLLRGSRCEGQCMVGPNLTIEGKLFSRVTPEDLRELLEKTFPSQGGPKI